MIFRVLKFLKVRHIATYCKLVKWEIRPPFDSIFIQLLLYQKSYWIWTSAVSIAYLFSYYCTKKSYWIWTSAVKVISEGCVVYFFCNTVHILISY